MTQDIVESQPIELTREIAELQGVRFDPTRVCLTGVYSDELSLFRAKRSWSEILEENFLLEKNYDYEFSYHCDTERLNFILNCEFVTSCGRYAFWRLTNNQAPEAQYLIETAHIPNAELRHDDFISAPDMEPVYSPDQHLAPLIEDPTKAPFVKRISSFIASLLGRNNY